MHKVALFLLLNLGIGAVYAQKKTAAGKIIFRESFNQPLDTATWKTELQPSPGSTVTAGGGKLTLTTGAGVTVWLKKKLSGNIAITYDRLVVVNGGPFDRLSDLNQFWMATDPARADPFTRSGKLEDYDNMSMYYVGMGGNTNKTTRFRKYANGDRVLIGELLDAPHLLQPNHLYHIEIRNENGVVTYAVDGVRYFTYTDPSPLTSGYFGFRSTKSNQEISNLVVTQLPR